MQAFGNRVNVALPAAQRHRGEATRGQPVGIEPAVGGVNRRGQSDQLDGPQGGLHHGRIVGDAERFILLEDVEFDASGFPLVVLERLGRFIEGRFVGRNDLLAEFRIVAAAPPP